jgi:tetratricopeptide (TPR) repeat protein
MSRLALLLVLLLTPRCLAGLHYSGETFAELPCQWRGLLIDQRALRQAGVKGASPLRTRYEQDAARLEKKAKRSPDEAADLGALYLRLGNADRAVEILRLAQAASPKHFRLAANLGTAWHLQGRLSQATAALDQAVRLAPKALAPAERLHLALVRSRAREKPNAQSLDDLAGVKFVGPSGRYEPGRLDPAQRKLLTPEVVGRLQLLALWLPGDARLLWQLAEVAAAGGDVATAAAIMDGCVTEFGLRDPDLLAHRKLLRAAADDLGSKKEHDKHAALFVAKSSHGLVRRAAPLPPVDPKGLNPLSWEVVGETTIDRKAVPTFARRLRDLDGLRVEMRGYMQPLGEGGEGVAFLLIEYPVGCWYCEMPGLAHTVLVELPDDETVRFRRERVRVRGKLVLNRRDPENFLYTLRDAEVADAPAK